MTQIPEIGNTWDDYISFVTRSSDSCFIFKLEVGDRGNETVKSHIFSGNQIIIRLRKIIEVASRSSKER